MVLQSHLQKNELQKEKVARNEKTTWVSFV